MRVAFTLRFIPTILSVKVDNVSAESLSTAMVDLYCVYGIHTSDSVTGLFLSCFNAAISAPIQSRGGVSTLLSIL